MGEVVIPLLTCGADNAPVPAANNAMILKNLLHYLLVLTVKAKLAPPDKAALPAIVANTPEAGAKKGTAAAA